MSQTSGVGGAGPAGDGANELSAEWGRLREADIYAVPWRKWGPYLAERAWGTVREDYSANGDAWSYFPWEQAISRAYRWNEDGMAGICDDRQLVCLALSLWNGHDPILKERAFGLTNTQGNHGEDVKECWWYLDATPTSSWLQWRYHYPQRAFPYEDLVTENGRRNRQQPEYELIDTGVFDDNRYFVVTVTWAKDGPEDLLWQIDVSNAGPDPAPIDILPTLWFRNRWSWEFSGTRPSIIMRPGTEQFLTVECEEIGARVLVAGPAPMAGRPNHCSVRMTPTRRSYGVHPARRTQKTGSRITLSMAPHQSIRPRAARRQPFVTTWSWPPGRLPGCACALRTRLSTCPAVSTPCSRSARPKQTSISPVSRRLMQRPRKPTSCAKRQRGCSGANSSTTTTYNAGWTATRLSLQPPSQRLSGRNHDWSHVANREVISMPDSWEYPWYAAWDLGFHAVALAHLDPSYAKSQLLLLCREWYMHPDAQLPAYEWDFGDVNPPVQAGLVMAVWRIDAHRRAQQGLAPDNDFLERAFHKLLLNFTWWVNRKDAEGNNVFEGGFLGSRQHRAIRPLQTTPCARCTRTVRRDSLDGDVLHLATGNRATAGRH